MSCAPADEGIGVAETGDLFVFLTGAFITGFAALPAVAGIAMPCIPA